MVISAHTVKKCKHNCELFSYIEYINILDEKQLTEELKTVIDQHSSAGLLSEYAIDYDIDFIKNENNTLDMKRDILFIMKFLEMEYRKNSD